jgi:hypothetical protein
MADEPAANDTDDEQAKRDFERLGQDAVREKNGSRSGDPEGEGAGRRAGDHTR